LLDAELRGTLLPLLQLLYDRRIRVRGKTFGQELEGDEPGTHDIDSYVLALTVALAGLAQPRKPCIEEETTCG
jgi:hypothetical protein